MKFKTKEIILLIFIGAALIFNILAFVMFAAPFIQGNFLGSTSTGFNMAFNFDSGKNGLLFAAWFIILLTMISSLAQVVFFFLEKAGVLKLPKKSQKDAQRMNLVFGVIDFLFGLIAAIFIFVTVPVFELGDLYSLGVGAILSGIFAILGGLCICGNRAVDYLLK